MLEIGAVVGSVALWPGDNPLAEVWVKTKAQLENQDQSDDWAFWIWWYDGLLSGTAPDPASPWMQEIALLPDALWQDEGAALARINEIWRGAIADTASATLVAVDATIGAIRSERGIGHNMPPEPIDEVELTDPLEILYQLRVPLADVTIELAKPTPDTSQLASLGQKILRLGVRFARYCGELADTFLKELAKKLAAPAAIALVGWAVVSTTPSVPFEALGNALKNLGGAQVQHPVSQGSDIKNRPQRAKR